MPIKGLSTPLAENGDLLPFRATLSPETGDSVAMSATIASATKSLFWQQVWTGLKNTPYFSNPQRVTSARPSTARAYDWNNSNTVCDT